ncbi:hypothetical protein GCM10010430_34160 [Kitasatospora cystarginea]|uniref:Crystal protein ET79 n=2 Tax=Streptomycetaceae TaxID=2062 RepID=A0ABN3E529_9ACTN
MKPVKRLAALAAVVGTALTGTLALGGTAQASPANAARSTVINLHNGTGCTLTLQSEDLAHGVWDAPPPQYVYNTRDVTVSAESNGFMTGDEGGFTYVAGDCEEDWRNGHTVLLQFDNPYAGSNGYYSNGSGAFRFTSSGGEGNNAVINWGVWKS